MCFVNKRKIIFKKKSFGTNNGSFEINFRKKKIFKYMHPCSDGTSLKNF